ncbi:hypothetical protein LTR53_012209 [Teratosphaeriaceae sp. CCFEE 6253]|nr:hypothetical protein LTR53_012209 [Teratosphaeriaceae sp. CCFEE 6253]
MRDRDKDASKPKSKTIATELREHKSREPDSQKDERAWLKWSDKLIRLTIALEDAEDEEATQASRSLSNSTKMGKAQADSDESDSSLPPTRHKGKSKITVQKQPPAKLKSNIRAMELRCHDALEPHFWYDRGAWDAWYDRQQDVIRNKERADLAEAARALRSKLAMKRKAQAMSDDCDSESIDSDVPLKKTTKKTTRSSKSRAKRPRRSSPDSEVSNDSDSTDSGVPVKKIQSEKTTDSVKKKTKKARNRRRLSPESEMSSVSETESEDEWWAKTIARQKAASLATKPKFTMSDSMPDSLKTRPKPSDIKDGKRDGTAAPKTETKTVRSAEKKPMLASNGTERWYMRHPREDPRDYVPMPSPNRG